MDGSTTGNSGVGGGNQANTQTGGGNPQGNGQAGQAGGGTYAGNPNAPTVIDVSEDSMVRLPGQKDPVKYGEYYRKFQSEFTKRAQEAQQARQQAQQQAARIQELERRIQQGQAQQQGEKPNPVKELTQQLKSLQYLNGEQAAQVVESIMQQVGGYEQALQQRDMALGLMYRKLQQMEQGFKQIQSRHTMGDFESKMKKFASEAGIPDGGLDFVKELYLAYEGDDLDQEFPSILSNRWTQIQNMLKEQNRKRVEEARNQPFVPGRGGNGSPSRQLQDFSRKSAREIADLMWPGMVDGSVET